MREESEKGRFLVRLRSEQALWDDGLKGMGDRGEDIVSGSFDSVALRSG